MTAVALYRGPPGTYNALAVDAFASLARAPDEPWWEDKLRHPYGQTYATGIGNSLILHALMAVVDWLDPERPNLKSLESADHILGAYDRRQQINEALLAHHPPPHALGVMLFVCSRADAFYWIAGFDPATKRSKRPTKLFEPEPGKCVVMWGSERATVTFEEPPADPFDDLPKTMLGVEREFISQGKTGMNYRLDGRFSVVVLPHKTTAPPNASKRSRRCRSAWRSLMARRRPSS